jgi:hypothetical protein
MFAASGRALATGNAGWMKRYAWFTNIIDVLSDDVPGKPLDG